MKQLILLVIGNLTLIQLFHNDYSRFKKSAFRLNKNHNYEHIQALITIHYHSIEKGLSHKDVRLGFGKKAVNALLKDLREYKSKGYPLDNTRYKTGCSVLYRYIKIHEESKFDVNDIKESFYSIVGNTNDNTGGYYQLTKEEVTRYKNSNFAELANNRYSVRNFSDQSIDPFLINSAIQISMKTPSVCNRQPWKVYIVKEKKLQKDLLIQQNGLNGFGENMDTLLVVTAKNSYFGGAEERNQGFIDGGMFSMSLLYALEHVGLAACALNADFNKKTDDQVRRLLDIKVNENLILFIAVGHYPSEFKVPMSKRENYEEVSEYICG